MAAAVDKRFGDHSLNGYHGILIEAAGGYDLYGKDGTHQHFAQPDPKGPRLSYVEDTDGNRVGYDYDLSQGAPRVRGLQDSAGRRIDLTYTIQHVHRDLGGFSYDGSFPVVSEARGPGGLSTDGLGYV